MMIQGVAHLVSMTVINRTHLGGWAGGDLWSAPERLDALPPETGAFWMVLGSFGLPLLLLGAIIDGQGRAGIVPPAYVAWGYGIWGIVCTAVMPASPFVTALIPAIMLLVARRRTRSVQDSMHDSGQDQPQPTTTSTR
jgi:hypothetical protein